MNKNKIFRFYDQNKLLNHKITDVKFAQVIAGRIVYLYSKYNIKKYNLGIFHKDSQPICPCYSNYLWHSTGVVLRAKKIFETNKYTNNKINFMEWPRSGSLEIDKITAKYIKRTFQIKIKYLNIINKKPHNKKNTYQVRTVGLYDYIRDLFLIYKYVKDSVYEKITSNQKVLLIAHETNINNQPYNYLEKELKIACKKNNLLLITKCSHNFGIKFVQRISVFLKTIKFILKETLNLRITKLSDFHFIFFYIATKKFEENLSNYYKDNSIISVGTTYIDWLRMDRFYRACKKIGINFIHYDYSLGYPFTEGTLLRYGPDTRKYADIIFANSEFRKTQYELATKYLDQKPKILLHPCPQSEYCSQKLIKNNKQKESVKKNFKLAVVDNVVKVDEYLQIVDVKCFYSIMQKFTNKFQLIIQTKRGYLKNLYEKEETINSTINSIKGDFSFIREADLICSLGFQGTALKAANLFKKPVIFFTNNKFEDSIAKFSEDNEQNKKIINNLNKLWFYKENFEEVLNKVEEKYFLNKINLNTQLLLNGIGIKDKSCVRNFFKGYYFE